MVKLIIQFYVSTVSDNAFQIIFFCFFEFSCQHFASELLLGVTTLNQEVGIIQASVYVEKGVGEIVPADIAQEFLDLFPRNLQLTNLRIDKIGTIAAPFYDDAWHVTPVTIQYQNLC